MRREGREEKGGGRDYGGKGKVAGRGEERWEEEGNI